MKLFGSRQSQGQSTAEATNVLIDPICGMTVKREHAAAIRTHGETEYLFCSVGCAETFDSNHFH